MGATFSELLQEEIEGELTPEKIIESKEVKDIATSIGVNPGSKDISKLRYGKICVQYFSS